MDKKIYRAKDKETGKWIYGQRLSVREPLDREFIITDDNIIWENEVAHGLNIEAFREVDPETLSEYTTVDAKNGDRIFEGDVVECISWNEFWSNGATGELNPFRRRMIIVWHNGGWKMMETYDGVMKTNYWDIIYDGDVAIIGNIYDNPELKEKMSFVNSLIG